MRGNRFLDEFQPEPADVAICGSMTHKDQWELVAETLRSAGLSVHTPMVEDGVDWDSFTEDEAIAKKRYYIDRHIANISASSAVLVCNYEKNNEPGYVDANVLMEMTAAYIYGKPLYIMQRPETSLNSKSLEVNALGSILLENGVDDLIKILKEGENDD